MIKNRLKRVLGVAAAGLIATAGTAALTTADAQAAGDGRVTAKPSLTVRYAPTDKSRKVGSIAHGKVIPLSCKVTGSQQDGHRNWILLPGNHGNEWIAAWHVDTIGQAPQWCGNDERFVGRATTRLSVRMGPNTDNRQVRVLSRGEGVNIRCKIRAQRIDGNRLWYWTNGGNWVSARYVDNVGRTPNWCVEM